jgi:hypothetical protein
MTTTRTDLTALSFAEFADRTLPGEIQYEIDDEGLLHFTAAGEAYWAPQFRKWGYAFDRCLPVDEFEDISTAILLQEMHVMCAGAAGHRAAA